MALVIKQLIPAFTLSNVTSETLLYRPPTGKSALIKDILLTNRNPSVSATISLFVSIAGDATTVKYVIDPNTYSLASYARLVIDDITLAPKDATTQTVTDFDTLWYKCNLTDSVDCVINGFERDL